MLIRSRHFGIRRMTVFIVLCAVVCLTFLTLAAFLVTFTAYISYQHLRYRHIPGPPRDGFFSGNVPFFSQQIRKGLITSQVWFDWQRRYGHVFVFWIYYTPVLFISDPEMIKKILVTLNLPKSPRVYKHLSRVFGHRCFGEGILTETDHEVWQRKRTALHPAFHRKYLRNLMDSFNSCCDDLLEKLRGVADGVTEVRMVDEFARVTLDIIGKVGFGIEIKTIQDPDSPFPSAVSNSLEGIEESFRSPFWMIDVASYKFQNSVGKSVKFLRTFAEKVIREREQALQCGEETPPDILAHLLNEKDKNPDIGMEDLVDNFLTLFMAGQETTSNHLSFTLYEILMNEEIEQRMLREVDETLSSRRFVEYEDLAKLQYMEQVLKESLRLHPPIGGNQRIFSQDSNISGYHITRGTGVTVSQFTTQNIPDYWKDPDVFDPERFSPAHRKQIPDYLYFPFSIGPRTCIGKTLAKFESKVLMAKLLQEFEFKLLPGQTAQIEEKVTIKPRDGVVCTLVPRK